MDTRVTIRLKDGKVVERLETAATGHPSKPMSREQLEAKFFECAGLAIGGDQARQAADAIWALDNLADVAQLHKTMSGGSP